MNDNIIIHKFFQKDLFLLKSDWLALEKGRDMSYFQTYDWYESINDVVPSHGKVFFFSVSKKGKVKLIAPFWILKRTYFLINNKGCYFWGREGFSDYLNFVYDVFDAEALLALLSYVNKEFGVKTFYLEFLREETSVVPFLEKKMKGLVKTTFYYAELKLPTSREIYISRLSRHVRQNLRTANNRSLNDGVVFEYEIVPNLDEVICEQCLDIRNSRMAFKEKRERANWSLKTKIHMFVVQKLGINFPYRNVMKADKNGCLLLVKRGDDLAAFFYFGYEPLKKRITIMTAGTNTKYARYSPGVYHMFLQIQKWIEDDSVEVVDFTRGNEQYKFDLGCEKVSVCNMSFSYR